MSRSYPRPAESRYYIRHHKREFRFPLELDATPKTMDDLIFMGLQKILSSPPKSQSVTSRWMLCTESNIAIETIEMVGQLPKGTTLLLAEKKDVLIDWSEPSHE
jgi:hypothetical protein